MLVSLNVSTVWIDSQTYLALRSPHRSSVICRLAALPTCGSLALFRKPLYSVSIAKHSISRRGGFSRHYT